MTLAHTYLCTYVRICTNYLVNYHMYIHSYIATVQLDLNFMNTRMCNSAGTTRI